jgi:hypothetical protein
MLRLCVYDIDGPEADLSHHDFVGYMECTLGKYRCQKHQCSDPG